ncbi:MAG: PDZ domain-containing protein, partial [Haloplanus sp.]
PVGGDVLLAIEGTPTDTTEALGSYLALETRPGETVSLTILRDGSRRMVELELGTRPTQPSPLSPPS